MQTSGRTMRGLTELMSQQVKAALVLREEPAACLAYGFPSFLDIF